MKYTTLLFFFSFLTVVLSAQKPHCWDKEFDKEVARYTSNSVPLVDVDELKSDGGWLILDAREEDEYNISHIPGARNIGYDNFTLDLVSDIDTGQKIAVYCSIGYRSEKIGERLQKAGFSRVHNVYGSIFEWANRGYPLENAVGQPTKKVHTYNKKWSKWVLSPDIEKVW